SKDTCFRLPDHTLATDPPGTQLAVFIKQEQPVALDQRGGREGLLAGPDPRHDLATVGIEKVHMSFKVSDRDQPGEKNGTRQLAPQKLFVMPQRSAVASIDEPEVVLAIGHRQLSAAQAQATGRGNILDPERAPGLKRQPGQTTVIGHDIKLGTDDDHRPVDAGQTIKLGAGLRRARALLPRNRAIGDAQGRNTPVTHTDEHLPCPRKRVAVATQTQQGHTAIVDPQASAVATIQAEYAAVDCACDDNAVMQHRQSENLGGKLLAPANL